MGEKWFKEGFNNFGKEREREREMLQMKKNKIIRLKERFKGFG